MAEEGEGVSLPETNKREQSTETKEAVRTMKRKKKHHGMELQEEFQKMEEYTREQIQRADDTDLYVFLSGEENSSNDVGRNTDGCDMTV